LAESTLVVNLHNEWRAKFSIPPWCKKADLVYDTALGDHAQAWANTLAQGNGEWDHNPNRTVAGHGITADNLAKLYYDGGLREKSKSSFIRDAISGWGGECEHYDVQTYKIKANAQKKHVFSLPPEVGHFTQLIWKSTTKVGCGISLVEKSGKTICYVVCVYYPPGNVGGQHNVNI
jgi:hypothetical protein